MLNLAKTITSAGLLLAMVALMGQSEVYGQIKPAPPPVKTPADPAADPAKTSATNVQLLFADCYTYKRMDSTKDKGFSTYLKAAPHEAQMPADEKVFGKTLLDQIKSDTEVEVNRGPTKGVKVTKIKFLRFGLSEDNSRFSEVEVLFDGTKPKGGTGPDTEPLVASGSPDTASVTLTLEKGTWTAKHSEDMAGQWRKECHIVYGRPDKGETWAKILPTIESKLKIRPIVRKDDD